APLARSGASTEHALARDDEAERRLAGNLAVDCRDALAAAEALAELVHRDLEPEGVAWDDDALEARLVDAREEADPIAEAGLLRDEDRHRLGERLHLEHAGHDRQAREVALGPPLGGGHALDPDDPLGRFVVLDDPVDHEDRPAMRDQRLDLAGRVNRAGRRQRVGHRAPAAAAARKAAPPTRSSRFVVIRPSRKVSLLSSARWISMLVVTPSTRSSSSAA